MLIQQNRRKRHNEKRTQRNPPLRASQGDSGKGVRHDHGVFLFRADGRQCGAGIRFGSARHGLVPFPSPGLVDLQEMHEGPMPGLWNMLWLCGLLTRHITKRRIDNEKYERECNTNFTQSSPHKACAGSGRAMRRRDGASAVLRGSGCGRTRNTGGPGHSESMGSPVWPLRNMPAYPVHSGIQLLLRWVHIPRADPS